MFDILIFLIAVSLSMDAFSLSLAYGTLNLDRKKIITLSSIVGIYHFFMPLLGMKFGNIIFNIMPLKPKIIVFVVLSFIGIQMIIESFKHEETVKLMKLAELLLFGLGVSIDSFSVGIGLKAITNHIILTSLIFSITSFIFTYLGLYLGKKINDKIGKISTFFGGLVLILIGIKYLI